MRNGAKKIIGSFLFVAMMGSPSVVAAETFLEGAKPFYLEPCPAARTPDPYPLPATMSPGSDTRLTCQEVVRTKPVTTARKAGAKKPAKRDVIEIHQK